MRLLWALCGERAGGTRARAGGWSGIMQPGDDSGLDKGASTEGGKELLAGTHMLKVKLTELVDGLNIEHGSVRKQW